MSETKPHASAVSLDDLLQANKAQFDRIFTTQMSGGAAAGAAVPAAPAEAGDATARLNARFGDTWSMEVVEHKAERGVTSVLCRLTVDGVSKMQFGSARSRGNTGLALQQATEDALLRCAAMFAEAEGVRGARAPEQATEAAADQPRLLPPPTEAPVAPARAVSAAALPGRIDVALRNARDEMEIVASGAAMTPALRDGHGLASLVADARGRMLVGRFSYAIAGLLDAEDMVLGEGDMVLLSEPGAAGGLSNWLLVMPVFDGGEPVGYTAMRGRMPDVGGPMPGSASAQAGSIHGEGLSVPPLKLFEGGELNTTALKLILGNARQPAVNRNELMALADGCQTGAARVQELCRRHGRERYGEACEALLAASNRVMRRLIVEHLTEEPHAFEDVIDDDGQGNGPFRLRLTVWREGETAFFDWTGTAPQAPGPVNFYLSEELFKLTVGMYLAGRSGTALALNDGIAPQISVTLPQNSLLQPGGEAPRGLNDHTEARYLEVLGGALSHSAPQEGTAASYGGLPRWRYSGVDGKGKPFMMRELLLGGLAGRPAGDGIDGHSMWPNRDATPVEFLERHYPVTVERRRAVPDSGGAGRHRGGNGVETVYQLHADGVISLQDDRHQSRPWGLLGGGPGKSSERWLEHGDGSREALPAKIDGLRVRAGERLIVRTAGGGGWGDPLDREPRRVQADLLRGLIGAERVRERYGVVLHGDDGQELDSQATDDLRASMRRNRRTPPLFDHGGRRDNARADT